MLSELFMDVQGATQDWMVDPKRIIEQVDFVSQIIGIWSLKSFLITIKMIPTELFHLKCPWDLKQRLMICVIHQAPFQ